MNSSDSTELAMPAVNPLTRRSFMKKTALTAGAVTLLGQGIGLAASPSSVIHHNYQCGGFTPSPTGHIHQGLDAAGNYIYYQVGLCECNGGTPSVPFAGYGTLSPPWPPNTTLKSGHHPSFSGCIPHWAGHTLPDHAH